MSPKLKKLATQDSTELIVYQIGEVKNLMENINIKFDAYKESTDKRISALENFRSAQEQREREADKNPKLDVQKIILALIALLTTVISVALGLNQR